MFDEWDAAADSVDCDWSQYVEPDFECPESLANDIADEIEALARPRWLRRNGSFASGLEVVERTGTSMWQEQSVTWDLPSVFVEEEGVNKAGDALEAFREALPELIRAILGKQRMNRQERRAAIHGHRPHVDRTLFEVVRPRRTHAPPGQLVATSPNRPNGPPVPRVAPRSDDVMAAAA